jgi:sensor domain CHASE-containing protein
MPQIVSHPSSRLNQVYLVQTSAQSAHSHLSPSIEQLKSNLLEKISEIQNHRQLAQKLDCNPDISQSSVALESAKMSMVSGRISI